VNLATVAAAVADAVPYLQVSELAAGDDWLRCDRLIGDPATLTATVRRTMAGFETDDDSVAASLFTQAYSFRVAGVALAAHALGLPLPNVAPEVTAVRVEKPRPAAVAYFDPEVRERTTTALAAELLGAHMAPFVDAVHREFAVGERLLWGNVAGSCATAYRAVESSTAPSDLVRARASEFVAAADRWFAGVGAFTVVESAGRDGWFWDRTSCCLWFRTTSGQLCDNCSLIDAAELLERRVGEVGE
jgi:ferric iron reductase protein FhuF